MSDGEWFTEALRQRAEELEEAFRDGTLTEMTGTDITIIALAHPEKYEIQVREKEPED